MFCTQCGKNVPDGSSFCSGCGKRLQPNMNNDPYQNNTQYQNNVPYQNNVNKGLETPVDGAVYSIKGVRGRHIDIYENKCIIRTKATFGSFLAQNLTDGEKTIYYKDCVGVQFKKSGFTIGYLQFETSAGMMNNQNSNFFGENSFTFDGTQISNEKMIEVYEYVRKRIDDIKTGETAGTTVVRQASPAEELIKFKELLDMGIITQEEFDMKKKQILGF